MSGNYFNQKLYDNLDRKIKEFNDKMANLGNNNDADIGVINNNINIIHDYIYTDLPKVWDTKSGREVIKKMQDVYSKCKDYWDCMYTNLETYRGTRLYYNSTKNDMEE